MVTKWTRFVALGDSLTEGVGDPDHRGALRGWADRFAERLASDAALEYANLAVRGMTSTEVVATQLADAVALRPQLASCVVGMNDLIRPRFSLERSTAALDELMGTLTATGATVITATLPDPGAVVPMPGLVRVRFTARMDGFNAAVREVAARHGVRVLDLVAEERDQRGAWGADRLHPGEYGHQLIADRFAELVGLSARVQAPAPAESTMAGGVGAQVSWAATHVAPWLWRRMTGRPASKGVQAKLPDYARVDARAAYRAGLPAGA